MCVLRTLSPFQIAKICCSDFILMDFMMKKLKKDNFKNLHFFRQEIRLKLDRALICDYLNFLTRYGSQMLHGDFFCQNTISKMVKHAKMGQKLWILAIFSFLLGPFTKTPQEILITLHLFVITSIFFLWMPLPDSGASTFVPKYDFQIDMACPDWLKSTDFSFIT